MNKNQTLRRIARKIRKKAEIFADKEGFSEDLMGLCDPSSIALRKALWVAGIHSRLIEGWFVDSDGEDRGAHYWLEWQGMIVDITATQFGIDKKVHICNKTDPHYRIYDVCKPPYMLTNISELILTT